MREAYHHEGDLGKRAADLDQIEPPKLLKAHFRSET